MKRTITLLLTLTLLSALPGCNSETESGTSLDSDRAFIHYGGMGEVCATEDTVYFTDGDLVHYYDKTTGISGILCGKAECEHSTANGSSCNAYINSISLELQVYNGRLYWIRMEDAVQIRSMALDGTDHRIDRTVESGFFSDHTGNRSAIFHRGAVYIWIEEYTIINGEEAMTLDMAVVPLDPDEEPYMIFQEEMNGMATRHHPIVAMQGYQDNIYILTSAAGSYGDDPDGDPDFYDLQIRRYNAVTRELTTLYRDTQSSINYTVELWVMDDGIVFFGFDGLDKRRLFQFDFETGEITSLSGFGDEIMQISGDLVVSSDYTYEKSNPTNPWGLTLAPQDIEMSGKLHVVIRNFAGDVLVDDTYPLNGVHFSPEFCGNDDRYAYFFSGMSYSGYDGSIKYMSLIGVALDGSGMEVLCNEEEYYKDTGTRNDVRTITLDDGTTIIVEKHETITIIPGDGGETVTMTVEELIEKGYQP